MSRVDVERGGQSSPDGERYNRSLVFPGAILPPETGWCLACSAHWVGAIAEQLAFAHKLNTRHPTTYIPPKDAEPATGQ